jgi:hypothetical protein
MTFENPLQKNDCAKDYQDSHLDYLCALGEANDIEVEEAIMAYGIDKLGFDPSKQKNITIHIPSQLLSYGSDEPKDSPPCGIDKALVINRAIDDVILRFDRQCLEWQFFLKNSTIPDSLVKVTSNLDGKYSIEEDAFKENINIHYIELAFDTIDSSIWWRVQVFCGSRWFDHVCCKISFDSERQVQTIQKNDTSKTPLELLSLPIRVFLSLKRRGITSIEELESTSDVELMTIKGFRQKSLNEVKTKLHNYKNHQELTRIS